MRPAFEFWYSDEGSAPKAVECDQFGVYKLMSAQLAWVAWQAASTVEREACLQDCAGWTTLQRPDVNDGKPWQAKNDPNGYCRAAIKERSAK